MDVLDENLEKLRLSVYSRMEELLIRSAIDDELSGPAGLWSEDNPSNYQSSAIPMPDIAEPLVEDRPNPKWASEQPTEAVPNTVDFSKAHKKPSMFAKIFSRVVSKFVR